MRKILIVTVVSALLAGLMAGCSPTPTASSARAELERHIATVDAAVEDLLSIIDSTAQPVIDARSRIDVCQDQPRSGVAYRAGISVHVGDDRSGGFATLASAMQAGGWSQSSDNLGSTRDSPAARFTRGDLTVDVKTGGFTMGTERFGADKMEVGVVERNDCVRVPDGGYVAQVKHLAKDYR